MTTLTTYTLTVLGGRPIRGESRIGSASFNLAQAAAMSWRLLLSHQRDSSILQLRTLKWWYLESAILIFLCELLEE